MAVTFKVAETPRVYVERIDINGNTTDPRQGDPPRVPPRRGRSVQHRAGQALARPHPVARLLPGQSRDRAEPGLGARPGRARGQGRGEADRPAPGLGRLFEPRALPGQRLDRAAQLHGPGRGSARRGRLFALFQVDRAGLHRALSVRPQHRGRLRRLPPRSQQLQLLRHHPHHDLSADIRPAARSASASRSPSGCSSRCATASPTIRSRSTRRPIIRIRTAPGRCRRNAIRCSPAAISATRSATG